MKSKINGSILAIIFGFAATIPWIILIHFGWIASLAGYLIGLAAHKGYVLGNGDFDRLGKICIILIIIAAVPFAEIANIILLALENGYELVESLLAAPLFFLEYIGDFIPSLLIGYFMSALGVYSFIMPNGIKKIKFKLN